MECLSNDWAECWSGRVGIGHEKSRNPSDFDVNSETLFVFLHKTWQQCLIWTVNTPGARGRSRKQVDKSV